MHGRDSDVYPEARTNGVLAEQVGDETVVYDAESSEAHCLRPIAAAVFARCDGRTSIGSLPELVGSDLGEEVSVEMVHDALSQLEERGLLLASESADGSVSRRQMLRRTAVAGGAAMAAPLIASIIAPTPALAWQSCSTSYGCRNNNDCPTVGSTKCECTPCYDCKEPPYGYKNPCGGGRGGYYVCAPA
jgi:hypothetical protein